MTGAGGLLGRHVVSGWDSSAGLLTAVGRSFDGRKLDLASPQDVQGLVRAVAPDVVLHLAGGPSPDVLDLYARNVLTGINVMEAVSLVAPDSEVVLVGSAAEYGRSEADSVLAEEAPLQPVSEYGRAKVAQTRLAQTIAARSGVHLTILRPFNIVSADLPSSTALGNARRQMLQGTDDPRTIVCGRTDVQRDFIAVTDVAAAVIRLSAAPPGGVLNLCSGRATSLDQVLAEMARQLGVEVRVEVDRDLAALPAGDVVVGDPSRLAALGMVLDGSPDHIASTVLGRSGPRLG